MLHLLHHLTYFQANYIFQRLLRLKAGCARLTPTATNMIHNNLRSANPPPGATEQYPGTNRLGNNYVAMPGVYWYADTHPVNKGPFEMKVTERK